MRIKYPKHSIKKLCGLYGKSRQAWYERCWREWDTELKEEVVVDLIKKITAGFKMGIHNLYPVLKPRLQELGIKMGRDKVNEVRRRHGLLVSRRRKTTRTTHSAHHYYKWPFIADGLIPQGPESLWVADITYIRVSDGFAYLSLITDAYSRKVVGYNLSHDLSTQGCLFALERAISSRLYPNQLLIHHSDRGVQYCSSLYTTTLLNSKIGISMGRKGEVLDNAIAERMNGILKNNYRFDSHFPNFKEANERLDEAIHHYNEIKPHSSIERLRPAEAHKMCGELKRKWK